LKPLEKQSRNIRGYKQTFSLLASGSKEIFMSSSESDEIMNKIISKQSNQPKHIDNRKSRSS
jgi:hypothetical protein